MPKAIYVKFDDCDIHVLPPGACAEHHMHGHDATCAKRLCAVQPGVFAVKPITRMWRHYLPDGRCANVKRKQPPLVPLEAVNLYSMQGTTADPGMYAYCMFPKRCLKQCNGSSSMSCCPGPDHFLSSGPLTSQARSAILFNAGLLIRWCKRCIACSQRTLRQPWRMRDELRCSVDY